MLKSEFFATWSKLHGGAEITGIVKIWLRISFALVKPMARIHITPAMLTSAGLLCAIALSIFPYHWSAALFLTLSLFFDGIDGSLAVVLQRTSKFGAFLDSFADRISEVFWALALYRLGAPVQFILIASIFAFTQEYLRARSAGLGHGELGIITIGERPIRASFIFIAIIANILQLNWITIITVIWALFQSIALFQLTFNSYRRFKD